MLFSSKTLEECTESLARYHPNGKLFTAKNLPDKNYYKFLSGLSEEICRAQDQLIVFLQEVLPDQTTLLIEEWESAVGIPDDCYDADGVTAERRRDILSKLASSGLQTAQDFVDFGELFGFNGVDFGFLVVEPGIDATPTLDRFTIKVTFPLASATVFPYTFPFIFGGPIQSLVQCLFERLKPANCAIVFATAP